MAVSTFFGLQTSLRGLLAHQRSLDTTGHNIANASTKGYSRQEAVLEATPAYTVPAGNLPSGDGFRVGSGVGVTEYRRVRNSFLDVQYRAQASVLGDSDARARLLEGVELSFAEPSTSGISAQLERFWSGWSAVANDPNGIAARQALIEQGKTVADALGELDGQLATLQGQAADELESIVAYDPAAGVFGEIGSTAMQIAQLGDAIRNAYLARQTPNDLLDQRDLLLDKLSQYGSVSTVDHGDGGISVLFGGAATALVDDRRADDPATAGDDRVVWSGDAGGLVAPGGRIGALMELSADGGTLDRYRGGLEDVAEAVSRTVNAIHNPDGTGKDIFAYDPAQRGAGLRVVATTGDITPGSSGFAGGNDRALAIARLRGGEADSTYQALVTKVGAETRQNARTQANAEMLVGAVEDRRASTSGVSLDEEMTNLVRFQRGYQACARTLSTMDEMLDVLINRTGRVGL